MENEVKDDNSGCIFAFVLILAVIISGFYINRVFKGNTVEPAVIETSAAASSSENIKAEAAYYDDPDFAEFSKDMAVFLPKILLPFLLGLLGLAALLFIRSDIVDRWMCNQKLIALIAILAGFLIGILIPLLFCVAYFMGLSPLYFIKYCYIRGGVLGGVLGIVGAAAGILSAAACVFLYFASSVDL